MSSIELVGTLEKECWRPGDRHTTGSHRVIARLRCGTTVIGDADPGQFHEGLSYRFVGDWDLRPAKGGKTYGNGKTFVFRSFIESEPADRNGVVEYLARHCDGIGPAIAGRLYDAFRGDAVKVLRLNPEEAARKVDRLRPEVATAAADKLRALAATEETMIELTALFAGRGFPKALTQQVFRTWGAQSAAIIRHDPYQLLVRRFRGVGFARVDALYLALGKPPQKLRRQVAALWDLLDGNSDGHTYLRVADLERGLRQRIGGDRVRFRTAFRAGFRLGLFSFAVASDESGVVALRTVADLETGLAAELIRLGHLDPGAVAWPDPSTLDGISDHQRQELAKAFPGRVCCLLGTPGTGKTWSVGAVVRSLIQRHGIDSVVLCAPTGKAAVRLTESMRRCGVLISATTIHRALGIVLVQGGGDGEREGFEFKHHAENPIPCRFLVVDEASMVDQSLAQALLSALADGTHVLLVGDLGQLPPVGRGAVLRDVLRADFPRGELAEIRRNAGRIVHVCQQIRKGVPWWPSPQVDLARGENLTVVHCRDAGEQIARLLQLLTRCPAGIDPIWDVQVLVALNENSPVSREPVNRQLQAALNPMRRPEDQGQYFRPGDKAICLKNEFYLDAEDEEKPWFVANGEIGCVVAVEEKRMVVRIDTGGGDEDGEDCPRLVAVPFWGRAPKRPDVGTAGIPGASGASGRDSSSNVPGDDEPLSSRCSWALAYAITVHKSQGSSAKFVFYLTDERGGARLVGSRELVYTALSRAELACSVLGQRRLIDLDCRRVALAGRLTLLAEKIRRINAIADQKAELLKQTAAMIDGGDADPEADDCDGDMVADGVALLESEI